MDESQREFIRQELRRKQSEIWAFHDSHPTPELFHFTSPQGFRGIIGTRQLWCTDVGRVNDPREGDHGLSVVKSVLKRKSVYKWFKEPILSSDTLFGMKDQWTSYIACFCSTGEQPYMWQDYAACGTGCALVFDYDTLLAGAQDGKRYAFFRMLYDQELQFRRTEQTVDHAIHSERELEVSGSKDRERHWMEVLKALITCAVRFKDPIWSREQEVRLWVAGGSDVKPFDAFGKPRVSVEFEASSLKRVIRGPAAGDDLSIDRITDLLEQHHFASVPVVEAVT